MHVASYRCVADNVVVALCEECVARGDHGFGALHSGGCAREGHCEGWRCWGPDPTEPCDAETIVIDEEGWPIAVSRSNHG